MLGCILARVLQYPHVFAPYNSSAAASSTGLVPSSGAPAPMPAASFLLAPEKLAEVSAQGLGVDMYLVDVNSPVTEQVGRAAAWHHCISCTAGIKGWHLGGNTKFFQLAVRAGVSHHGSIHHTMFNTIDLSIYWHTQHGNYCAVLHRKALDSDVLLHHCGVLYLCVAGSCITGAMGGAWRRPHCSW